MQVSDNYYFVGASCYNFRNDDGQFVQGTKVTLIPLEMAKKDNYHGYTIDVFNAAYDFFGDLRKLHPMKPYTFRLDVDTSGKVPKIRVLGVTGEVKAS